MSDSPINILQRFQELKLWQENHEELLKKTKNLVNTSANVTNLSDYQTIEGLSEFDLTMEVESPQPMSKWESQIISPTKTFNELLEEKLAEDPGPVNLLVKPKKPFLKKGTGLQRFRITPDQKPQPRKVKTKTGEKKKNHSNVTPLKAPDLSIKPKATWSKIKESEDHIRKINELAQLSTPEPSEQTLYEKALEKELLIFEALEQKAEDSSFCSTNSSVVRILSSTPSKIKRRTQPPIIEEKRVHWESQSEDEEAIESNLERRDIAAILHRLQNLAENNIKTKNVQSPVQVSEDDKWSTEASSQDTSLSSTDLENTLKTEKRDMGVGTNENFGDVSSGCLICGDALEKKISEYEKNIQDVIQDKNRINEIKKELEKKKQTLEKDFIKIKKEFEDEKKSILFDLDNEKKRLMKEKQVYQTYIKDSQNRPSKREREEISNLKQEVADLKEVLKLKESKNGMTQARLRNQIKQLEKENSNLKDEVEKLTRENAKLTAAQKLNRRPSDTKILHEINKNISKLTKNKKTDENSGDEAGAKSEQKPTKHTETRRESNEEDSFVEMTNLEKQYDTTFRSQRLRMNETSRTNKIELVLEDGTKQVKYPNGNIKSVSPDGNFITLKYFNGDLKETYLFDGIVKYFYCDKKIWQTSYPDGTELVEFPDGVLEKRFSDGKCEITLPEDIVQTNSPDGNQEVKYPDGSVVTIHRNGEKVLFLPNGQKEIETKEHRRREYPDGTVKILYPDGTQETRYANGRVRIRDASGALIVDSQL